jgi:UrcA family protein
MNPTSPKNAILAAATAMALAPAMALVFLAPGASAQPRSQPVSISVEVAGALRVDTKDNATALKRIRDAAENVCAAVATHSPLLPREQADCVRDAVAEAMRQITTAEPITIADAGR